MKIYNSNENENDEIKAFGSGREKRHWISNIETLIFTQQRPNTRGPIRRGEK